MEGIHSCAVLSSRTISQIRLSIQYSWTAELVNLLNGRNFKTLAFEMHIVCIDIAVSEFSCSTQAKKFSLPYTFLPFVEILTYTLLSFRNFVPRVKNRGKSRVSRQNKTMMLRNVCKVYEIKPCYRKAHVIMKNHSLRIDEIRSRFGDMGKSEEEGGRTKRREGEGERKKRRRREGEEKE